VLCFLGRHRKPQPGPGRPPVELPRKPLFSDELRCHLDKPDCIRTETCTSMWTRRLIRC
jgi:hypothetical protein